MTLETLRKYCSYCNVQLEEDTDEGDTYYNYIRIRRYFLKEKEIVIPVCYSCTNDLKSGSEIIRVVSFFKPSNCNYDFIGIADLTSTDKSRGYRST